jgi:putative ATP-dependent endonuclease of OLD family
MPIPPLVEGETEFWLMPELAEVLGYDFALEGVRLMEYAQCGVEPLVRFADDLGIAWHLMADGDASGRTYLARASAQLEGRDPSRHLTAIAERDVEHCLWNAGYADVYRGAIAGGTALRRPRVENPRPTIERAIRARSKPGLALAVAEKAHQGGTVPAALRHAIESAVALARASVR